MNNNPMRLNELLAKLFPGKSSAWMNLLDITGILNMPECTQAGTRDVLMESLNHCLQKKWLRHPDKERWHLSDDHFTQAQKNIIIQCFQALGLYNEIAPPKKYYDAVFLMGSLEHDVRSRLAFLIRCWRSGVRFPRIYILTGHRVLLPAHEPIAHTLEEEDQHEMVMINKLMDEAIKHGAFPGVDIITVYAPNKPGTHRATTHDTLLAWVNQHDDHDILLISHQPYVGYQHAVAVHTLSDAYHIDAAGPGDNIETLADGLDTLARTVYVLKDGRILPPMC